MILPSSGTVETDGVVLQKKTKQKIIHQAKAKVGMVFQFPEHQLFESTVLKDVMFGPMNMGVSEEAAREKACYYLDLLNVHESLLEKSPFELSGGQMRKVAIAGILAMEPSILILDEPLSGVDVEGMETLMDMLDEIRETYDLSILMTTHDFAMLPQYADQVVLINHAVVCQGSPIEVLGSAEFRNVFHRKGGQKA